jgi:hypothetical protein
MVFDVLAADGADLRFRPLVERRQLLEQLGLDWRPPLQVSPATTDEATALEWATDYRPAGIEGVMVKAAMGRYRPGRRDWIKVKSRESSEVIIGAVTGPLTAPQTVVVGLLRDGASRRLHGEVGELPLARVHRRRHDRHKHGLRRLTCHPCDLISQQATEGEQRPPTAAPG